MLLQPGHVCPRSWLTETLWGERPPGSSALRTVIYGLRQELDPAGLGARIQTRQAGPLPGGYLILAEAAEVDLHVFRALAEAGRAAWYHGEAQQAAALLAQATLLWRGPPLADLPATRLAASETSGLCRELRDAQDTLMDTQLALGRHEQAVQQLRAALSENPLREHTWAQLIVALYRNGRKEEALRAYAAAREALVSEYGSEPGPELVDLRRRVLACSPDLLLQPAPG
jgi:DNA-binding SARP family transcriptional activator